MKAVNVIALLASGSLTWAATVDLRASAAQECGALGVLEAPAGAGTVRKCRDHPMGNDRGFDPADTVANAPFRQTAVLADSPYTSRRATVLDAVLEKRCEPTPAWGCGKGGFCWKSCGPDGEWCWTTTLGDPNAPWARCTTYKNCGWDLSWTCGVGCDC